MQNATTDRPVPPGRAAARHGRDGNQPGQRQHAGLQDRPHPVRRLARTPTGVDPVPGGRTVAYTQDRATYREQAAGALTQTGNPLDLALSGAGFFTVQTKAGPMLTRAGRFDLQRRRHRADADGNALLDTAGQPVRVSAADTQLQVPATARSAARTARSAASASCSPPTPTACRRRATACSPPTRHRRRGAAEGRRRRAGGKQRAADRRNHPHDERAARVPVRQRSSSRARASGSNPPSTS